MRDIKQRHSQKCRGWNCEKGNNGTKMQRYKLWETETKAQCCRGWKMRHKPLRTAKRTLNTTLLNFSVVVGSLHVDEFRKKTNKNVKLRISMTISACFRHGITRHCSKKKHQLECGPMPNMTVALPHIGGALWSTPQSLPTARLPCSNAANRRAQDLEDAKWILHLSKFRYGAMAFYTLPFPNIHVSHFPPPATLCRCFRFLQFSTLHFCAADSVLAVSTPAFWCHCFLSRSFMSHIFSVPTPVTF